MAWVTLRPLRAAFGAEMATFSTIPGDFGAKVSLGDCSNFNNLYAQHSEKGDKSALFGIFPPIRGAPVLAITAAPPERACTYIARSARSVNPDGRTTL
ncbi:MAG: hypothetical protein ACREFQ_19190, partial [Stellaceae bacterium]